MTWMIGGVPPFEEPPTYIEFDWYAISNLGFAQEMLKKPPKNKEIVPTCYTVRSIIILWQHNY